MKQNSCWLRLRWSFRFLLEFGQMNIPQTKIRLPFTNHSLPSWLFQIVVFTCWIERWEMGSEQHLFCTSIVPSTIFEHPNSWKAAYFSVGKSAFCFRIWRHTHFPAIVEIVAEHIQTAECANWPLGCMSQGPNLWATYVLSSTLRKTMKVEQCTGSFLAFVTPETTWLTRDDVSRSKTLSDSLKECDFFHSL